jgi:MAGE family
MYAVLIQVFAKAQELLKANFGMQMHSVVKNGKHNNSYYLTSTLSPNQRQVMGKCVPGDQLKNLQMVILSLIYAHGKKMPESSTFLP